MTVTAGDDLALIEVIELIEQEEREWCAKHPAYLIDRMYAVDERDAEEDLEDSYFYFDVLTPEERREANATLIAAFGEDESEWPSHLGWRAKSGKWFFQREVIDWWVDNNRTIALKARQLGITWDACAFTGWTALYRPGSTNLHYRQREDDAFDNVRCTWAVIDSLPKHLWNDAELEKPSRVDRPIATKELRFRFPDGRASTVVAQTSASESGHGRRAATIVLDEFSRIESADGIMKAANSAAGQRGKILIISTANGLSNPETGEGNRFHWQWVNAAQKKYAKKFLGWYLHPDRDQEWYESSQEVLDLKAHEKAEQYPANEDEAFTLTNRTFFDPEDLARYFDRVEQPVYKFDFERKDARQAVVKKRSHGLIAVYREPEQSHSYAIGADVASGRGRDYSVAYVIDLTNMELAAEFRGRIDSDQYAYQLHYLGKMFNGALIAVETAGGWGEAVIVPLRDGREGRPAYPRLYQHVMSSRPTLDVAKVFGFPTNVKTRPLILNQFEKAVREQTLPYVTRSLLDEMKTFNLFDTGTSPRAQDGAHDDCVMACAIALEMYRLRGEHPDRARPKPRRGRLIGLGRAA